MKRAGGKMMPQIQALRDKPVKCSPKQNQNKVGQSFSVTNGHLLFFLMYLLRARLFSKVPPFLNSILSGYMLDVKPFSMSEFILKLFTFCQINSVHIGLFDLAFNGSGCTK